MLSLRPFHNVVINVGCDRGDRRRTFSFALRESSRLDVNRDQRRSNDDSLKNILRTQGVRVGKREEGKDPFRTTLGNEQLSNVLTNLLFLFF